MDLSLPFSTKKNVEDLTSQAHYWARAASMSNFFTRNKKNEVFFLWSTKWWEETPCHGTINSSLNPEAGKNYFIFPCVILQATSKFPQSILSLS